MSVIAVILIAAAGIIALRRHPPPGADIVIEDLDPRVAFDRGVDLLRRDRTGEALPYLARAAADPGASSRQHYVLGTALYNLTLDKRRLYGLELPWPRTNRRSVALIHDALEALQRAESLATTSAERARMWSDRGLILAWWGLPVDAHASFRRAFALDPRPEYQRIGDVVLRHLLSNGADSSRTQTMLAAPRP